MKRKSRFSFLLLAGIILLAAGLIGLSTVPDLMQYAFLPSDTATAAEPAYTAATADDADFQEDAAEDAQATVGETRKKEEERSTPLLTRYDETVYKAMGEMFPKLRFRRPTEATPAALRCMPSDRSGMKSTLRQS